MDKFTLIILNGGKGLRLGGVNKGLLQWNSLSFLDHLRNAAKDIFDDLIIIGENEKTKDIYKDKGPVGGIYSGLYYSQNDHNIIIACDMPMITESMLSQLKMHALQSKSHCVLTEIDDEIQPLIGFYNKSLIDIFHQSILNNRLKLLKVINEFPYEIGVKITAKECININEASDLNRLYKSDIIN